MKLKHIELNNEITKQVNGFYDLGKDREAVVEFMKYIGERTVKFEGMEKYEILVGEDYYYQLFNEYSREEVQEIIDLVRSEPFEFQSFTSASMFYQDYGMKTDDKSMYLEDYQDRVIMVSLYLGRGDVEVAKLIAIGMIKYGLQPATPTFLNSGKARRGELVSCFLLEVADDLNSIGFKIAESMQLSKIGGGVSLNLSNLRRRGSTIKKIKNAAKGIVPVMKLLEDAFSYADQMGQRKGAGAAYYNVFGWDVIEFLDTKKINADEKSRIQSLSIGLVTPAKFYELAEKNEPYYLFDPFTVEQAYGIPFGSIDIDKYYDDMVANPDVDKRLSPLTAREMLTKIGMTQLESGYPYIMNVSNANEAHALRKLGRITFSNLCTEIFQLSEVSKIGDYEEDDVIKRDISCNLASLKVTSMMEANAVKDAVYAGMYSLTSVSDMSNVRNAPSVKKANEELHSVGLGLMDFHGFCAKNQIHYESEEARDLIGVLTMMMNFYSIEASMQIAKDKGETFEGFADSDYADGSYFERYVTTDFTPKTEKVKELFKGMHVPTIDDWRVLRGKVAVDGMYHAYRLAIAPTGRISYVQNATPSISPILEQVETRTYNNSTTYYPAPYLSPETAEYYKSAFDMSQYRIIDLYAEAQQHIDQGISCVLHVYDDISTRELSRLIVYAHKKGLKSLYYVRAKNRLIEDFTVVSAECESCSI